jgi:hypothetical protein
VLRRTHPDFLGPRASALKSAKGTRKTNTKTKRPRARDEMHVAAPLGYKATAMRSSRNDKPEQKQTSENKTPGGAFAFAAPPGGECSHLVANWLTATRPLGLGFAVNPGGR